jgi:hypothetical protein
MPFHVLMFIVEQPMRVTVPDDGLYLYTLIVMMKIRLT